MYLQKKIILYIKNIFKIFFFIIYYSRFYRIISYFQRNQAIILVYHSINIKNNPNIYPDNIITYESYKRQIEYLKKSYQIIPLIELVKILEKREKIPSRTVCLTFDDGYRDFLENALPVLDEYGLPATVFPITGLLYTGEAKWEDQLISLVKEYDGEPLSLNLPGQNGSFTLSARGNQQQSVRRLNQMLCKASPDERERTLARLRSRSDAARPRVMMLARELAQLCLNHRITVGCHTHTHTSLGGLDASRVRHEAYESRRIIEDITGRECTIFSYPFGKRRDFNQDTKNILRDLGFAAAVTTLRGRVAKGSDPYELRRIAAVDDSSHLFKCSLVGLALQS